MSDKTIHNEDTEFVVSVSFEVWTEDGREAGEPDERGWKVERERLDPDELKAIARELGISAASSSAPGEGTYFISETPSEDRAHFERGEDRYFALHVHTVDGYTPDAEDFQRIGNLIGVIFREPIVVTEDAPTPEAAEDIFGYYVNLDERGSFYADVRSVDNKTVFEVRAGNELGEDDTDPVTDGFMKHLRDVDGLTTYLRDLEVISRDARVVEMQAFEAAIAQRAAAQPGPRM